MKTGKIICATPKGDLEEIWFNYNHISFNDFYELIRNATEKGWIIVGVKTEDEAN